MDNTIDILIPTYNRERDLAYNLTLLISHIRRSSAFEFVKIIVSDNGSTDSTVSMVKEIIRTNSDVRIVLLEEYCNRGLLNNIVKVLQFSSSQYIMYIGDDDFIPFFYFNSVIQIVSSTHVSFVLPERKIIDPNISLEEQLQQLRLKDVVFAKTNFFSRIYLSSQCNQLTGIVFKNNDLIGHWCEAKGSNLYPFMSFAGWSLTPGSTAVRVLGGEVLITSSNSKDWGYGETGLLPDIIDNAKLITENGFERVIAELCFAFIWRDRIGMYLVNVNKKSFKFLKEIFRDHRILLVTRSFILLMFIYLLIKFRVYKAFGRLKSPHCIK
jgi:abequosyltransferase